MENAVAVRLENLPAPCGHSLPKDRSPYHVYLASLSINGRRTMGSALGSILRTMGIEGDPGSFLWSALRFSHIAAIRSRMVEDGKAPATINHALAALRGVAKAAFNLGLMTADDFQRLANVPAVKGTRLPKGRALDMGEVKALFQVCAADPSPSGRRDAAILAVLFGGGLRRDEVVNLDLDAFNVETGELKVRGKGNRERLAYASNGALSAILDWLEVRGMEPGPLFLPIRKDGKIGLDRMSNQAVYNMLAKRAEVAGVENVSPHDFRRTFISTLLENGADISTVQGLAGHANVQTTIRYDRRPETAKRKAAELLHVPFVKR